jgi:arylsulfatase A-like enzyme
LIQPFKKIPLIFALVLASMLTFSPAISASSPDAATGNKTANKQPNIVFLLIDDWGWQDVGFMGSSYYDTPNMDALAKQSIRFDSGYSAAPNCAPTRSALMSGQYAPRTGIYTVGDPARGKTEQRKLIPIDNTTVLDNNVVTMAESIKAAGYNTAFMGKWHLGAGENGGPLVQGFDVNIGGNETGAPQGGYFAPYTNADMAQGPDGEYLTDRLTREAVSYIEQQSNDKPFFLYLSHYAVHTPIQAPKDTTAKYKKRQGDEFHHNAKYGAMVDHVDQGIGKILAILKAKGFDDNTLIILTADNGGFGPVTQAPDLRGYKGSPYEGGNRVPLLFRMPEHKGAGRITNLAVNSIDFYPTLVEIAGAKMPKGQISDGESLIPILNGGNALARDALFYHFPAYLQPYGRVDKGVWRARPFGAIRMGDYKLVEFFEYGQLELYNLVEDRKESKNLALEKPQITAKLLKSMQAWRAETNAPIPTKLNPEYNKKFAPTSFVTWQDIKALIN